MAKYLDGLYRYMRSRKRIIAMIAPMAFGLLFMALCIVSINRSLSSSEVKCANLVQAEFPRVLSVAASEQQSPLYILALKTWSHFLGHTDFAMRMLSVLCGALLVLLIYLTIRRTFGLKIALLVSFLAASSPLLVALGQSINSWIFISLEVFLVLSIIVRIILRHRLKLPRLAWISFIVLLVFNVCGLVALYAQKSSAGKDLSQTIAVLDDEQNTSTVCDSDELADVLAFYSGRKIYHDMNFSTTISDELAIWFITTIDESGQPHTKYEREGWRVTEYSSMVFSDGKLYVIVKLEKE